MLSRFVAPCGLCGLFVLLLSPPSSPLWVVDAFSITTPSIQRALHHRETMQTDPSSTRTTQIYMGGDVEAIPTRPAQHKVCRARDLVKSLIEEDLCYTTEAGAIAFADVCAVNCVYEDRYEAQPIVGKIAIREHLLQRAQKRKASDGCQYRIDKISDGNVACGFAWTWTTQTDEGLRGTTFVELNDAGEIQFVCEIPEPIYKPGDATKDLLKLLTKDAIPKPPVPYEKRIPTVANEVAKYLFLDLQKANKTQCMDEMIDFFSPKVVYRDFNYENVLNGPAEVRQFVTDFNFPGITFNPLRFDDGIDSTCFTWEVILADAPDTVKGVSFYELDPTTRKITYVRDIPESAIKPPILGRIARFFNPKLGVFKSYPIGSRPGGL